jgi:hypothetical protein
MSDEKQSYAVGAVGGGHLSQEIVKGPISETTKDSKIEEPSNDISISKDSLKSPYSDATKEYSVPPYTDEEGKAENVVVSNEEDLVTRVIHVEDDPTLNPWTFRMFFLGTLRQVFF